MKIAIIGASGKQGALLTAEAAKRGMDVTAIVRDTGKVTQKGIKVYLARIFSI